MTFCEFGGIFDAPEPSGRLRQIPINVSDEDLEEDIPTEEPSDIPCVTTWIGKRHTQFDNIYTTCFRPEKWGWLGIDFYPETVQLEDLCYQWVSAFKPVVVNEGINTIRLVRVKWLEWSVGPFTITLPVPEKIWIEKWYEHYVCVRVGGYYDTNCGERLLTEVTCKSTWVMYAGEPDDVAFEPPTPSEGMPPQEIESEEGQVDDEYPPPPDDEPPEQWEQAELMAWDWQYPCKPYNFAYATSWKWLDDVKWIIRNDPNLKLIRFEPWMDGSVQKQQIFDGSCVENGIAYAYRVLYLKRSE
jgi:hypothetical protein